MQRSCRVTLHDGAGCAAPRDPPQRTDPACERGREGGRGKGAQGGGCHEASLASGMSPLIVESECARMGACARARVRACRAYAREAHQLSALVARCRCRCRPVPMAVCTGMYCRCLSRRERQSPLLALHLNYK